MKLLIKEYHDVMRPEDVTFGVVPVSEYEVDSDMIFNDHEIHMAMQQMLIAAEKRGWDWVQFYNEDRKILYHGNVVDET